MPVTSTWHFLDFLTALTAGTQNMLAADMGFTVSWGLRIFSFLAAIMLAAFGIKSLWWSQDDWTVVADKFKSLVVLLAIVLALLQFYNTPIPGVGASFPESINQTSLVLAKGITTQEAQTLLTRIQQLNATLSVPSWADLNGWVGYVILTIVLLLAEAAAFCVIVFGIVGQSVAVLLGPLFIPWLMVPKLSHITWGWLRFFLTFSIYPIVASAVIFVVGNAFTVVFNFSGSQGVLTQVLTLPVIAVISLALMYAIFKIPSMAAGLMSGVAHSDFAEWFSGLAMSAFRG